MHCGCKLKGDRGVSVTLNLLEFATAIATAIWVGYLAFPADRPVDLANGAMTAALAFIAIVVIMIWIKSGTDMHL
jgi:hypothetical protein